MFTVGAPLWGSAAGGGEPVVASLLHFDGTNGSTTYTNEVPGRSWSGGGPSLPTLSTGTKKFGTASVNMGNDRHVRSFAVSGLDFSGDYSVDFWMYPTGDTEFYFLLLDGSSRVKMSAGTYFGSVVSHRRFDDSMAIESNDGAGSLLFRWSHVFAGRKNGIDYIAHNGAMVSTSGKPNTIMGGPPAQLVLGVGTYSSAYFDELRVVTGGCDYTTNFTPPSAPYTYT